MGPTLSAEVITPIRFSEVDSLKIVWHGHYIKYFEDAREAFGLKYGIHYLDIYGAGFTAPIVKLNCDYKSPLVYGKHAFTKITYIDTEAAKLIFRYEIYNHEDMKLVATGETIQVFLDVNQQLHITIPEFFEDWKIKHGLK